MNKKSLRMGIIGMLSLMLLGALIALAIVREQAGFWIGAVAAAIAFLLDARVETKRDDSIGDLHLFSDEHGYTAVGFEFKKPIEQIASMRKVQMEVHILENGADE